MGKSPELIKKLEEDAEFRFFHSLGNAEFLEKFEEFRDLDWSKSETMETIKEYMDFLKSE